MYILFYSRLKVGFFHTCFMPCKAWKCYSKSLGGGFSPSGTCLTTPGLTNLQSTIFHFSSSMSFMVIGVQWQYVSFWKTEFSNVTSVGCEYHKPFSVCTRTGSDYKRAFYLPDASFSHIPTQVKENKKWLAREGGKGNTKLNLLSAESNKKPKKRQASEFKHLFPASL